MKKRTADLFKFRPNCVAKIWLYQNHFNLEETSDKTNSKITVQYNEINRVVNGTKCILIYYAKTIIPIDKSLPDVDYDLILKLLNVTGNTTDTPQRAKIKNLLLAMFVLSLLSIFFAMMTLAIVVTNSPLPEFDTTFPEKMWIFYLFVPLPLASTVLGIVFLCKKYKCKKNIIAGAIMCFLLVIYGSFSFLFASSTSHDFQYVHELEQTLSIDLPDSGYLSRAEVSGGEANYVMMIKFDDPAQIYNTVSTDERFWQNTYAIPTNFIDPYYTAMTSNYNYFMLYDVTANEFNHVSGNLEELHRFLYVAYNTDTNVLFVLDFLR